MINLELLIQKSRDLLQELVDGTHELIQRSTPATWGELQQELEEKLIPILYKLFNEIGGLKVIPTITLPDGITSTSLVSQSEMTQYVTNTLNVWLASLMEQVKAAKNNTIYSLQPVIVAVKKIPKVITINVASGITEIPKPAIEVEV